MILVTKISDQTRPRVHAHSLYSSYLSPELLVLPSPLPLYYLDIVGRHLLKQNFLVCPFRPCHNAPKTISGVSCASWPSSALLDPVPYIPSLGSGPQHNAMVLLGRRVLWPWLLATRWRRPPSHVFRLTSLTTSKVPRLSFPLHSPFYNGPRSYSRSCPHSFPRAHSRPCSRSCTCYRHRFLFPVGSTSSCGHRVLRQKLLAIYRGHFLPITMMSRVEC